MAQMIEDMDMVRRMDGREQLADLLTSNPIAIFTNEDVREEFINIDFREITARYLRASVQEGQQEQGQERQEQGQG